MPETFEAVQRDVIAFRNERDWQQFHRPKELASGLQIEAAELAELFLWRTDAECSAFIADPESRRRLEEELADVQIFLLYLAEKTGVSIPEAVRKKLAMNAEKYPVEKSKGSAVKYTEFE